MRVAPTPRRTTRQQMASNSNAPPRNAAQRHVRSAKHGACSVVGLARVTRALGAARRRRSRHAAAARRAARIDGRRRLIDNGRRDTGFGVVTALATTARHQPLGARRALLLPATRRPTVRPHKFTRNTTETTQHVIKRWTNKHKNTLMKRKKSSTIATYMHSNDPQQPTMQRARRIAATSRCLMTSTVRFCLLCATIVAVRGVRAPSSSRFSRAFAPFRRCRAAHRRTDDVLRHRRRAAVCQIS